MLLPISRLKGPECTSWPLVFNVNVAKRYLHLEPETSWLREFQIISPLVHVEPNQYEQELCLQVFKPKLELSFSIPGFNWVFRKAEISIFPELMRP